MKPVVFSLLFLSLVCVADTSEERESQLYFVSGSDTACSRNCLFVSVNRGPYQRIGCNKRALGDCRSPGGLRGEIRFKAFADRCNEIRLKVFSQGKDNGVVHESLDSTHEGLVPDRHYHVNARTASSVDLWLNDNSDDDYRDFRVKLAAPIGVTIGIDRFRGAACP